MNKKILVFFNIIDTDSNYIESITLFTFCMMTIFTSIIISLFFIENESNVMLIAQGTNSFFCVCVILVMKYYKLTERIIEYILMYVFFIMFLGLWAGLHFFHPIVIIYAIYITLLEILLKTSMKWNKLFVFKICILICLIIYDFYYWLRLGGEALQFGKYFFSSILVVIGMLTSITAFKRAFEVTTHKLSVYSYVDSLTNAKNSRALHEDILRAESLNFRHATIFCVVYLDINDFKQINDKHGHAIGDQVLKETVIFLNKVVRSSDDIYRVGGDEFILLFNDTSKRSVESKLRSLTLRHEKSNKFCFDIIVSYGISSVTEARNKNIDVIKLADSRMYLAKTLVNSNFAEEIVDYGTILIEPFK